MMIHQIEQKMVNRLRQVTSAIRQTGDKQVDIIKSRAEREASIEFAKPHAVRPCLVVEAMKEIGEDTEVVDTLFSVLETQGLLAGNGEIILLPEGEHGNIVSFTPPLIVSEVQLQRTVDALHETMVEVLTA